MKLPAELRIRVYELLWDTTITTITDAKNGFPVPHNLCNPQRACKEAEFFSFCKNSNPNGLALLFSSPQIYKEAATSWLSYTTFFGPARLMTRFLDTLRPEYVSLIRKIEIEIPILTMRRSIAIELGVALLYYNKTSKLNVLTINLTCPEFGPKEEKILERGLQSFPGQIIIRIHQTGRGASGTLDLRTLWTRDKGEVEFKVEWILDTVNQLDICYWQAVDEIEG